MAQQLPPPVPLTCGGSPDRHIFHARTAAAVAEIGTLRQCCYGGANFKPLAGQAERVELFYTAAPAAVASCCSPTSENPLFKGYRDQKCVFYQSPMILVLT